MVTKREWVSDLRQALTTYEMDSEIEHNTDEEHMTAEVLNTGYTEAEFEEELDRREEALETLENSIVKHAQKYEQLLQKATEKRGDRKVRYLMKAKEQQIKHEIKNEIYDDLMRQHLTLVKILLYDKKKKMRAAGAAWDFEIDIAELPVDDMVEGIEDNSDRTHAVQEVIEELEMSMELDSEDALGIDLSDIEAEAAELEAADIADKSLDVDSELEADIDERIQDELAKIDDEAGEDSANADD
jgi:hypothetical protein